MKHIIIGTAGHIDHGKTTLIKTLTGRETDTLKEEQNRGISINLGFTYFDLPSGRRAGIIDVPGHEKFIKNMLAGISSVDVVLLVIAADEGIMPQTREHFEILKLLNIKKGIVVLTKADLVDEDWIEMIKEDIKEEFKGTFLENAKIHPVSSKTKMGFDDLIKDIDEITEEVEAKDTEGHFRLPVDRSFSISGFGTVVTGTIISGRISIGDTVEIYPSRVKAKVRGIRVHDIPSELGEAGQRCAINLANTKVADVQRGDVVAKEGIMEPSLIIDCKLYHIKTAEKSIVSRQRVRLYHGTEEILCRIVPLDMEEIKPGQWAYVQLRLEKPLTAQRNDRYIIRSYSPMTTIAGGTIIEPNAKKSKKVTAEYIKELELKESGKTTNILENAVKNLSDTYPDAVAILKSLGKNMENIEEELDKLVLENVIIKLDGADSHIFIHGEFLNQRSKDLKNLLEEFHKKNPLKFGMSKEEVKNKIFTKKLKQRNYDDILNILLDKKTIKVSEKFVSLYDFNVTLTKEQTRMKDKIVNEFKTLKFSPPKYTDLNQDEKDKAGFKMVYELLLDDETLIKLNEDCTLLKEDYKEAKEKIKNCINENGSISAATARELLETNRKYAIAILEHLDSIKVTKRVENDRILY
ncbi:MAG: selenocysteine-specific translation elongation factor [Clostridium sp.]|uniref:selenocysteine-specific translation elongation factor n=1 Tax=Clostridium sp. TaxID=1506 RepID=UPI00304B8DC9